MKPNKIRIIDISKKAGVSPGTVDRVIHQRGKVSPISEQRVNQVLSELGYRPNLIARSLGRNNNIIVNVVVPRSSTNSFWKQTQEGINKGHNQFLEFGFDLTVNIFEYDLNDRNTFTETTIKAFHSNPSGIILAPLFHHTSLSFIKELNNKGIPFVLINNSLTEIEPLTFVGRDAYTSGSVAAELMSLGQIEKSKYAIVHLDPDNSNSRHLKLKEDGFKQYLSEVMPGTEYLTYQVSSADLIYTSIIRDLMHESIKGIYVTSTKAHAIAAEFEKNNIKNMIIGYDLTKENSEYLRKGFIKFLIHQNPKKQARLAVQLLCNYLLFGKKPKSSYIMPLQIISKTNIDSFLI